MGWVPADTTLHPLPGRRLPEEPAQALQLGPDLGERRAHPGTGLDLGPVELRLHLVAQRLLGEGKDLVRHRPHLPGAGVDDAELLFDADGEVGAAYLRRSEAPVLQLTQRVASGRTSSRACGIGFPHASQRP